MLFPTKARSQATLSRHAPASQVMMVAGGEATPAGASRPYRRALARAGLRPSGRLASFLLVGGIGFVLNNLLMAAQVEGLGIHYLAAAPTATLLTTLCNFALTELWVFRDRNHPGERTRRLLRYGLLSAAGLAARWPLLFLLTSVLGLHYLLSNILSIGALTGGRYVLSSRWIWHPSPRPDWLPTPREDPP